VDDLSYIIHHSSTSQSHTSLLYSTRIIPSINTTMPIQILNHGKGYALSQLLLLLLLLIALCSRVAMADETITDTLDSLVPLIDIASWTTHRATSTQAERDVVVDQVRRACRMVGFFMISNHGIDAATIDTTWQASHAFFDLDKDTKRRFRTTNEAEYPYGFEESEQLVRGKQLDGDQIDDSKNDDDANRNGMSIDEKETFSLGPNNVQSGMPSRRWYGQPDVVPGFESSLVAYFESMEGLALVLGRIFALGLQQPEDYFVSRMSHHMSALRLVNYYPLDPPRNETVVRAGAHSDYGMTTILTAQQPGLQVLLQGGDGEDEDEEDDRWYSVPFVKDAFIINLGDLMQRWTNDQWKSTLHRVVMPSDASLQRRYSMAYFVNVNGETEVLPLDSCSETEAQHKLALQRYPSIAAKDHLMAKHLASMGESGEADGADTSETATTEMYGRDGRTEL